MSGTELAVRDKSVVERAFDLAVKHEIPDGMGEELDKRRQARGTFLPVEESAINANEARIARLETLLGRRGYTEPMLPLEPLTWRWKSGLPKLALLDLRSPLFTISASRSYETKTLSHSLVPHLPILLADQYADVTKMACDFCHRRASKWEASFRFEGVIPAPTRMVIADALRSGRFENLFMLVESPERAWKIATKRGISDAQYRAENINLDPIIVGWAKEALWVIDKFDLTTLEDYVVNEFTAKAELGPGILKKFTL